MSLSAKKREEVIEFILLNLRAHGKDIVKFTQEKFGLSRTTILRYLDALAKQQRIEISEGATHREYTLLPTLEIEKQFEITPQLAEDRVWREDLRPALNGEQDNVIRLLEYGFSEIFNNAIEHSEGSSIGVLMKIFPDINVLAIVDNGVGIFNKIQRNCQLDDPHHAILELSKGKLTTNPESHTGEGIFFTSRMFDLFVIHSDKLGFSSIKQTDILWDVDYGPNKGTGVMMEISRKSTRTTGQVFNEFADVEHGFSKTIVPVQLVRYGDESLISRSQARRMLERLDKFQTVILDFKDVAQIGRAFADEVFRVFAKAHPGTHLAAINTSKQIDALIKEIQSQQ